MSVTDKATAERMQCMEIWGGNRSIVQNFIAPGLDIYVHSAPFEEAESGGGDIYYLTSCASGRISRFLLADVSGHGEEVADIAVALRDMLRENVNRISQTQFVTEMNRKFGNLGEESGFATAIVATFFEPKKNLAISVAGHPYPIYYRARSRKWVQLDPAELDERLENLPLGVHEDSSYPGRNVTTDAGDMFLLYSDAFIESVNEHDQMIGINGILNLLNDIDQPNPADIIPILRRKISEMAFGNLLHDDATMILGHFSRRKVRLRDNFFAPFRLLGKVFDNTRMRG